MLFQASAGDVPDHRHIHTVTVAVVVVTSIKLPCPVRPLTLTQDMYLDKTIRPNFKILLSLPKKFDCERLVPKAMFAVSGSPTRILVQNRHLPKVYIVYANFVVVCTVHSIENASINQHEFMEAS